jgi:hypothetical protein
MLSAPAEQSLNKSRLRVYQRWNTQLAVVLALSGLVGLLLATRWGIGVSPDSAVYIGAARNLIAGRGLSVPFGESVDSPLIHYPPLYPILLATLGLFGLEPVEAARWLNALLFGGNALLMALALHRTYPRVSVVPLIGAVAMLISPSLFSLHVMAWTEALFMFLGLGALLALAHYVETARWNYLVAAGLLMAGATLTRYAGLALLATGVVGLIWFGSGSLHRRVTLSALLGVIGLVPTLAWAIRNWLVADTVANRSLAFHPITAAHLRQALDTVSSWLLIPGQVSGLIKLGGVLLVFVGLVVAVYGRPDKDSSIARMSLAGRWLNLPVHIKLLALFVGVYALFLVGSISFLDANTPLDERILSPVYVAGLAIGAYGVGQALERSTRLRRWGLVAIGLVFGLLSLYQLAGLVGHAYTNGLGFNQRLWRESPTLAQVAALSPETLIYSNAPEAVYLRTGRSALRLPRLTRLMEQLPNSNYASELAEMQRRLEAEAGVVVYFETVQSQSLPTVAALRESLGLELVYDASDGDLYTLNH